MKKIWNCKEIPGYNLWIRQVRRNNTVCYFLYLEKENFGDLQFIVGTYNYGWNIDKYFELFLENLECGNFFYCLDSCDAVSKDRYDIICED